MAAIDLSFVAQKPMTIGAINALFKQKSVNEYHEILNYCDEWLVSSDFNHSPYSLIFDATETKVVGQQAKVLAWYDNEWGYANRCWIYVGFSQNALKSKNMFVCL